MRLIARLLNNQSVQYITRHTLMELEVNCVSHDRALYLRWCRPLPWWSWGRWGSVPPLGQSSLCHRWCSGSADAGGWWCPAGSPKAQHAQFRRKHILDQLNDDSIQTQNQVASTSVIHLKDDLLDLFDNSFSSDHGSWCSTPNQLIITSFKISFRVKLLWAAENARMGYQGMCRFTVEQVSHTECTARGSQ